MNWQWIVTTIIAAYGAGLSTFNIWSARKKDRHQIKVKVTFGFLTSGPTLSEQMVFIDASNPGHHPVTVTGVGLRLPDKRSLVLMASSGTELPHHLAEGTVCRHWMSLDGVKISLRETGFSSSVKVKGFYNDALGEDHLSDDIEIDLSRN
jgi:hypothetical protein